MASEATPYGAGMTHPDEAESRASDPFEVNLQTWGCFDEEGSFATPKIFLSYQMGYKGFTYSPPLREWTKPLEKSLFFAQKPTLREWTKIFLIEKFLWKKILIYKW
ncbi:unnamed protein product [Blepharisma stoltei]|uniref:Uncharacterized protein n=1 Tax=Blepharisma stoltei TaxID=1481888 RepID=A0AAU9IQ44_9CILI|nr:unnamed protein product [Blepharisma stoltei]